MVVKIQDEVLADLYLQAIHQANAVIDENVNYISEHVEECRVSGDLKKEVDAVTNALARASSYARQRIADMDLADLSTTYDSALRKLNRLIKKVDRLAGDDTNAGVLMVLLCESGGNMLAAREQKLEATALLQGAEAAQSQTPPPLNFRC